MPTKPIQMRVPDKLRAQVDAECQRQGIDRTRYTVALYRSALGLDDNDEPRPVARAEQFRKATSKG